MVKKRTAAEARRARLGGDGSPVARENSSKVRRRASAYRSGSGARGKYFTEGSHEVAVVVTVTVNGEPEPLGVTEAGDTVQVARLGAPEQVSATVPVKPLLGAT